MAYRLFRGRPLAQEIKRLLDQETHAATSGLTHPSPIDHARLVQDTRKHIKKARALLHMARRPLGSRYADADEELRVANRALGPIADAHRVIETLAAARRNGVMELPVPAFSAMRARLGSRISVIEAAAADTDVRGRTVRLLASLRQEVALTDLPSLDRAAIVAEIRDTHAAARAARRRAIDRPTIDSFHRWRRMVKREWHLMRLVTDLTGDRLRDERHQLASLDACLGELHDVDVLVETLAATEPLSRLEIARAIKGLRAHAHVLRHRARRLSRMLDERPQPLARRIRRLWGAPQRRRTAVRVYAWPHSA